MRKTMRLSLAGAVALVLVGGLSGAVLTQSDEPTRDRDFGVWVSGTSRVTGNLDFGETTWIDEDLVEVEVRDRVLEGVVEASDPRVSGSQTTTLNYDTYPLDADGWHTATNWGTQHIENEGGAWECSWSGGEATTGLTQYLAYCVGLDGYAGWAMRLHLTETDIAGAMDFAGLLWPGDLPPLPEAPAAQ